MSTLNQFSTTNRYYSEYLNLINKYSDYNRRSIFCLYLNINTDASIINNETQSNYSSFINGVKFNSLEMTPLYRFNQLLNNTTVEKNKLGHQFTGETQITTYTIKTPNKNDLVVLPYDNQSNEIYRVADISAALSTVNTNKNHYFTLTLEYAPMKTLNDINIINNYVYLPNINKYLIKEIYIKYIQDLEKLNKLLSEYKFNERTELYYITQDENELANIKINNEIYKFMNNNNSLLSLFTRIPFGVKKYTTDKHNYYNLTINDFETLHIDIDENILKLIQNIQKYEQTTDP